MGQRLEHECAGHRLVRVSGDLLRGHQVFRPQRGDVRPSHRQETHVQVTNLLLLAPMVAGSIPTAAIFILYKNVVR